MGPIACPVLGMQLQVSSLAAIGLVFFSEGGGRGGGVLASPRGAVACPVLGMQLQLSPPTAIACLPTWLQLVFCFVGGWELHLRY